MEKKDKQVVERFIGEWMEYKESVEVRDLLLGEYEVDSENHKEGVKLFFNAGDKGGVGQMNELLGRLSTIYGGGVRDIGYKEYIEKGVWKEDKKYLESLKVGVSVPNGSYWGGFMSKQVMSQLREDSIDAAQLKGVLDNELDKVVEDIKALYRVYLSPCYGIEVPDGLWSRMQVERLNGCKLEVVDNKTSVVSYNKLEPNELYGVERKESRQYEEGVAGYYPYKQLEYLYGCRVTQSMGSKGYGYEHVSSEYSEYETKYFDGHIKDRVVLELSNQMGLLGVVKGKGFTGRSVVELLLKVVGVKGVKDSIDLERGAEQIKQCVSKVRRVIFGQFCNVGYVLKYTSVKTQFAGLVYVYLTSSSKVDGVSDVLRSSICSAMDAGVARGSSYKEVKMVQVGGYEVRRIEFERSSGALEGFPIFGYEALEKLAKKGKRVEYKDFLVGKDVGDKLVSRQELGMHKVVIHNIHAGSRSGKGVMTMTLLGSALGSGVPVFYLDRKPDMASVLHHISGGKMFVMNSSAEYTDQYDLWGGYYNPSGGGFSQKVQGMIEKTNKFNGFNYGYREYSDLYYFRTIMFMFLVIMLRVEFRNEKAVYDRLGGSKGICCVIDELTNWQIFSEWQYGDTKLLFTEVEVGVLNEATKRLKEVKSSESKLATGALDEKATETEEKKLKLAEGLLGQTYEDNKWLYYKQELFSSFQSMLGSFRSKGNAGFKGGEDGLVDVYVLGQTFKYYSRSSMSENYHVYTNENKVNKTYASSCHSPVRELLSVLENDYVVGNPDVCEYQTGLVGKDSDKINASKRYWGYYDQSALVKGYLEGSEGVVPPKARRVFKPYLVLNTSEEGQTFVGQMRGFLESNEITRGGVEDFFNSKRGEDGKLEAGIGLSGYIETIKGINGIGGSIEDMCRESGDIANFLAGVVGYSSYEEWICDLTVDGIFTLEAVGEALRAWVDSGFNSGVSAKVYVGTLEKRLRKHREYGFLKFVGGVSGVVDEEVELDEEELERYGDEVLSDEEEQGVDELEDGEKEDDTEDVGDSNNDGGVEDGYEANDGSYEAELEPELERELEVEPELERELKIEPELERGLKIELEPKMERKETGFNGYEFDCSKLVWDTNKGAGEQLEELESNLTGELVRLLGGKERIRDLKLDRGCLYVNGVEFRGGNFGELELPLDTRRYLERGYLGYAINLNTLLSGVGGVSMVMLASRSDIERAESDFGVYGKWELYEELRMYADRVYMLGEEVKEPSKVEQAEGRRRSLWQTKIDEAYKFEFQRGCKELGDFTMQNFCNYARSRGDKGILRYTLGMGVRGAGAVAGLGVRVFGLGFGFLKNRIKDIMDYYRK